MTRDLSTYTFSTYGSDARLYNGVHDLETQLAARDQRIAELEAQLAEEKERADGNFASSQRIVDKYSACHNELKGERAAKERAEAEAKRLRVLLTGCRDAVRTAKSVSDPTCPNWDDYLALERAIDAALAEPQGNKE